VVPLPGKAQKGKIPHGVDPFLWCGVLPLLIFGQRLTLADHTARDVFARAGRFHRCVYYSVVLSELPPRCGNVDPVAVDLLAFDYHISYVDADAKLHAALSREVGVFGLEGLLDLERTQHGSDRAGELGQDAIAGRADNAAVIVGNEGVGHRAGGSEGADGPDLVLAHEAAVAGDIGAEDSGELTRHVA
jgi:hypothetical protein